MVGIERKEELRWMYPRRFERWLRGRIFNCQSNSLEEVRDVIHKKVSPDKITQTAKSIATTHSFS